MKYIAQPDSTFAAIDETSREFELLSNLDEKCRPAFLNEKDKEVIAYLAAQAEASNLAQAKALEREAIDEVIREQFAKEIATKVKEKQAKRQNVK